MRVQPSSMSISGLALAGMVSIETIRYYQRKGLMQTPDRPLGGNRRYGEEDLVRLNLIRTTQRLGFRLEEIGELLKLDEASCCGDIREKFREKLTQVRDRITVLRKAEDALNEVIEGCNAISECERCPILFVLAGK